MGRIKGHKYTATKVGGNRPRQRITVHNSLPRNATWPRHQQAPVVNDSDPPDVLTNGTNRVAMHRECDQIAASAAYARHATSAEFRRRWVQLHIDWHKRYIEGSACVRLGMLQSCFTRSLWYGCGRPPQIDVAEQSKLYPDFEKHVDGIADALAHAFGESKEDVLRWFVYQTTDSDT